MSYNDEIYDLDIRLQSLNCLAKTCYQHGDGGGAKFFLDLAKDLLTKSMNPVQKYQLGEVVPLGSITDFDSYREGVLG